MLLEPRHSDIGAADEAAADAAAAAGRVSPGGRTPPGRAGGGGRRTLAIYSRWNQAAAANGPRASDIGTSFGMAAATPDLEPPAAEVRPQQRSAALRAICLCKSLPCIPSLSSFHGANHCLSAPLRARCNCVLKHNPRLDLRPAARRTRRRRAPGRTTTRLMTRCCLCLVFPRPLWLRHRLCRAFPLLSCLRHRLCLAAHQMLAELMAAAEDAAMAGCASNRPCLAFHCLTLPFYCLPLTFHCLSLTFSHESVVSMPRDDVSNQGRLTYACARLRHRLCIVFPLPWRLRHRLCLAFPLPPGGSGAQGTGGRVAAQAREQTDQRRR